MFSEAFIAWIHMKALRVFVESVLRYGLPVNFQAAVCLPKAKIGPKFRKALNEAYSHLDSAGGNKDVRFSCYFVLPCEHSHAFGIQEEANYGNGREF